ncbi:hypothetical protein H2198_003223 [Neophaeococcomyces mojaviensis]|uniref:Uncharacterized protein n=1 Tax=Neophaeococcomyces mojaviensis TaxID=3383035 RepID=A0ACC3ACQ8_9EURO|nr:hypothetical protein H2198_003223 [Knufia sp. JES_112]
MYVPSAVSCVLFALPFVSAVPLDLLGTLKNTITNTLTTVSNTENAIVTSASDIVDQVNKALGKDILPSAISSQEVLDSTLDDIRRELTEINEIDATFAGLLQAVVQTYAPDSIPDALNRINSIIGNTTNGVTLENVAELILNGLSVTDLTQNVLAGYALSDINSYMNYNNPAPSTKIYPRKSPQDAQYNVPERDLRAAVYFPPTFTFSAKSTKRPILFVPGTGAYGGVNFISNLGKLLGQDPRYDLAYLNVPGAMYNDTQINSEYIAYAINYVSSLTGNKGNLAVIGWSQGNLDTQWAFQYWPSTRSTTSDFISASADFHGTVLAYFLDPAFPDVVPNPPSVIQQEYDSNFVSVLRAGGGGSPYVPSTSVWSITDEIVQPQYDPIASASYSPVPAQPFCPVRSSSTTSISTPLSRPTSTKSWSDPHSTSQGSNHYKKRGSATSVPSTSSTTSNGALQGSGRYAFTNNQIQTVCAGRPAGGIYLHEGVLFNPLMYALTLDALENDGPGQVSRLDLDTVCNQVVAPGLSLEDILATEGLIPLAALNLLLYPQKTLDEPAIMPYAQVAPVARSCS